MTYELYKRIWYISPKYRTREGVLHLISPHMIIGTFLRKFVRGGKRGLFILSVHVFLVLEAFITLEKSLKTLKRTLNLIVM